jgi:hypothetical protein
VFKLVSYPVAWLTFSASLGQTGLCRRLQRFHQFLNVAIEQSCLAGAQEIVCVRIMSISCRRYAIDPHVFVVDNASEPTGQPTCQPTCEPTVE